MAPNQLLFESLESFCKGPFWLVRMIGRAIRHRRRAALPRARRTLRLKQVSPYRCPGWFDTIGRREFIRAEVWFSS
jgi:hypothetical protein